MKTKLKALAAFLLATFAVVTFAAQGTYGVNTQSSSQSPKQMMRLQPAHQQQSMHSMSQMTPQQKMDYMMNKMLGYKEARMGKMMMRMGVKLKMLGMYLKSSNSTSKNKANADKMISMGTQMFLMGQKIRANAPMKKWRRYHKRRMYHRYMKQRMQQMPH